MAQGTDVLIGHQRGTTWNTAISVNLINAGLLTLDWPLGNGLGDLLFDDSLSGTGFRSNAIRGVNKLNGTIRANLRYSGLEHATAMSMGLTGGAPTVTDTTAQTHVIDLKSNLDGLFDTVAVLKDPTLPLWEYPSMKYGGFTLTLTADGLATIDYLVVASSCKPLTGQVNTTLAAVTYRSKVLNVYGTHIAYRANSAPGAALASPTNQFYPSRVVLTYNRNLDSAFVMDGTGVQPEPYYTAAPEVSLALEFPVYGTGNLQANNAFMTQAFSEIPMKAEIIMTSPVLAGSATAHYSILLQFPNLVVGNVEMPISGPGVIPQNVQMQATLAGTAPAGMTGLTQPFRWTQVSQMTTNPLLNP